MEQREMTGPTREQVKQWADESGVVRVGEMPRNDPELADDDFVFSSVEIFKFAALAYAAGQAAEREAIAAWYDSEGWLLDEGDVPDAIRARGES